MSTVLYFPTTAYLSKATTEPEPQQPRTAHAARYLALLRPVPRKRWVQPGHSSAATVCYPPRPARVSNRSGLINVNVHHPCMLAWQGTLARDRTTRAARSAATPAENNKL